jgi:delta 1-pyrroline-5-carboxylate dehydrogenase
MSLTEHSRPAAALRHARMLINGARVDSASAEVLTVEIPARRTPVASIPRGAQEDVDRAVQAAHKAFSAWSKTTRANAAACCCALPKRLILFQSKCGMISEAKSSRVSMSFL